MRFFLSLYLCVVLKPPHRLTGQLESASLLFYLMFMELNKHLKRQESGKMLVEEKVKDVLASSIFLLNYSPRTTVVILSTFQVGRKTGGIEIKWQRPQHSSHIFAGQVDLFTKLTWSIDDLRPTDTLCSILAQG